MRRRPRRSLEEPEALDTILARTGENRFARTRPPFDGRLWRESVGARIADRAQPIALRDGCWFSGCQTACGPTSFPLLADDVCSRLRERGVEVRRLRFRVGEPPLAERRPEPRISRSVPALRPLPAELAHTIGGRRRRRPSRRNRARRRSEPRLADRGRPWPRAVHQRSAASRSSPSRRWIRNRSAGPNVACFSRRCATYAAEADEVDRVDLSERVVELVDRPAPGRAAAARRRAR